MMTNGYIYIIFRYYYNCNTEVSQWEKPREWLDYEKSLARQNYHVSSFNNHQ